MAALGSVLVGSWISPEMKAKLEAIAIREDRSLSSLIRLALREQYLEHNAEPRDPFPPN
jgi:predicted transcriptional regulator